MTWLGTAVLIGLGLGAGGAGAEGLGDHVYPLREAEGRLEGPGAQRLRRIAAENQFFLVGEFHGSAEVPRFLELLIPELPAAGYRHYAAEIGPWTARRIAEALSSEAGIEGLVRLCREHPLSIPFYDSREDMRLAAAAVRHFGPEGLWGLDYEMMTAARLHLDRLVREVPGELHDAVQAELETARECFRALRRGAMDRAYVLSHRESMEELRARLAERGVSAGVDLMDELLESQAIFALHFAGKGLESHARRAEWNLLHFHRALERAWEGAEVEPRVLLRFGANHMARGLSLGAVDLGQTLSELAEENGTTSFHLRTVALAGSLTALNPTAEDPYGVAQVPASPAGEVLRGLVPEGRWGLVDLVGAEAAGLLPEALRALAADFDALLVFPEVHPCRPAAPLAEERVDR